MEQCLSSTKSFAYQYACDCAKAFAQSTGLGTVVSDNEGKIVAEYGQGWVSCNLCKMAGYSKSACKLSQTNGKIEAEQRFGGKYVYFCALQLTCFVLPVINRDSTIGQITAGPFLMVDKQDYIYYELATLLRIPKEDIPHISPFLFSIPYITPSRISELYTVLFLSMQFENNLSGNKTSKLPLPYENQEQLARYVELIQNINSATPYPFDLESRLLETVSQADRPALDIYLNNLMAYIFLSSGTNTQLTQTRIAELLVLISRTVIKNGGDPDRCFQIAHDYLKTISGFYTVAELFDSLKSTVNALIDELDYINVKHGSIIHKATLYIKQHFAEKITLEQLANTVYISPAYFSRLFKHELGISFTSYLNNVRIEKSKNLLTDNSLKLVDIAYMVGFESQSYFTKVFKKIVGIPPLQYRDKCKF